MDTTTESSVSSSVSSEVGLKEEVERVDVDRCDNLEGLLEMKRKLEEESAPSAKVAKVGA